MNHRMRLPLFKWDLKLCMCITHNIVSSFCCHMCQLEFRMPLPPAKKLRTLDCIREIQVHKLWTKVYCQKGLTAVIPPLCLFLVYFFSSLFLGGGGGRGDVCQILKLFLLETITELALYSKFSKLVYFCYNKVFTQYTDFLLVKLNTLVT